MKDITLIEFNQLSEINADVTVSITIEDMPQIIDDSLESLGNIGSCATRVYWAGSTNFDKVEENNIDFHSKVRYEQWVCFGIKAKLFQETKTVDTTVFVELAEDGQTLDIKAQVRNIRNFPDWVEEILKIRAKRTIKSIDLSNKNVSIEKITLSSDSNGTITFVIQMKPIIIR